ncbi:DNA methyltransferase [Helicobacter sp. 23-1046]
MQEAKLRALDNDSQLLTFLLENPTLKARFFTPINESLIFDKEAFLDFLKLRILDSSYTRFANKIGLMIHAHTGAKLLKSDSHIVLNFPYKDCILKGAQSKDEDKSNEIFFNEILGSDEIDFLLKPKALQNFELITSSLRGSEATEAIQKNKIDCHESANADSRNDKSLKSILQNKPNFLIKGNNLLALHTLKSRKDIYGQVKLIYIDPPYNTGNDSFNYNDRFNHSAWLVFMKNRLEIAREFLREDGVIFIQCDDNEQAYLKVLMDEIFGRENFVGCITWHRKRGKDNSAKFLSRVSEYILVYAKQISDLNFGRTELDDSTLAQYTNPDNDSRGNYRKLALWRRRGQGGSKEYAFTTKDGITLKSRAWLCSETTMQELDRDDKLVVIGDNLYRKLFLSEHEGSIPETIWTNLSNTANAKDEIKSLFLENKNLKTDEESNLFATPKPEALLKRIIEISTKENDLVMDFFAGSGTTCAVAHKMKRRWVGIEQMDYVESITKERLIKVINGEQGGISKAVAWNPNSQISPSLAEGDTGGGYKNAKDSKNAKFANAESTHPLAPSAREGEQRANPSAREGEQNLCHTEGEARSISNDSKEIFRYAQNDNKEVARNDNVKNEFIYFELMPLNALYKARILESNNENELAQIYKELQEKAFVDYRVDKTLPKDSDFEALNLNDKKRILYEILDSNMDYVVYSDIEDAIYGVDSETIELNRAFYKGGKNE